MSSKIGIALVWLSVIVLLVFGLTMVASTGVWAEAADEKGTMLIKQTVFAAVGLVLALGLSCVNYRKYIKAVWWIYGISCFLLVLCYVPGIGRQINGESRWINLGLQFQPSECAKICVMMALARYYALYNMQAKTFLRGFVIPGIIFVVPIGLILFEKDMGTAAALAVAGIAVMFVSGCNLVYLSSLILSGAGLLYVVVTNSTNRMARIQAWLNLEQYKADEGLQQWRALIGLGRGGWSGAGIGNSIEKHGFLPFAHTDFIYAPLGEEFGFIGTFSVLLAFLFIVLGGIMMVVNTRDRFGRIWAVGILMMIFMPAMLNIAVVTASLPNSGLPLPFISFGGTNLVFTLGAIGILTSIQRFSDPLGNELDIEIMPSSKEIIRI